MTAQTVFEKFRFGYGTKQQFDTSHKHYGPDTSAAYLKKRQIIPSHIAVTLCFRTVNGEASTPTPNEAIVDQSVREFEREMGMENFKFIKDPAQWTCPAGELTNGGALISVNGVSLTSVNGVSLTYVTVRLPLEAHDAVKALVASRESSLDKGPSTRHQLYQCAPVP